LGLRELLNLIINSPLSALGAEEKAGTFIKFEESKSGVVFWENCSLYFTKEAVDILLQPGD